MYSLVNTLKNIKTVLARQIMCVWLKVIPVFRHWLQSHKDETSANKKKKKPKSRCDSSSYAEHFMGLNGIKNFELGDVRCSAELFSGLVSGVFVTKATSGINVHQSAYCMESICRKKYHHHTRPHAHARARPHARPHARAHFILAEQHLCLAFFPAVFCNFFTVFPKIQMWRGAPSNTTPQSEVRSSYSFAFNLECANLSRGQAPSISPTLAARACFFSLATLESPAPIEQCQPRRKASLWS